MIRESRTVCDLQVHNSFCLLNPEFRVLLMGGICFLFMVFNWLKWIPSHSGE